eukprot:scaffold35012_cov214-Amphora_coffeaeformis.AAC.2
MTQEQEHLIGELETASGKVTSSRLLVSTFPSHAWNERSELRKENAVGASLMKGRVGIRPLRQAPRRHT